MNTSSLKYTSFLVRLWCDSADEAKSQGSEVEWLVQIEHIPEGEKFYCASLDALFDHIQELIAKIPTKHDRQGFQKGGSESF